MILHTVLLACLPVPLARQAVGATLALSNLAALVSCLARARRFPQESTAWRLFALGVLGQMVGNVLFGLHHGDSTRWSALEPWLLAAFLLPVVVQPWGLLRLAATSRHPEGLRLHLLGSSLFGGSLALLLWILGLWQLAGPADLLDHGILLAICLRLAVLGGILSYQVVDDPRRMKGPLGWLCLAIALGAVPAVLTLRHLILQPTQVPLLAGSTPIFPILLVIASLSPNPVEPSGSEGRPSPLVSNGFLYLPFLASAGVLLVEMVRQDHELRVPMLGFLGVTVLLVAHQFALLREVQAAREDLDLRVRERTRDLEAAQDLMLRTERMNSLGLLGAGLAHDLNNSLGVISGTVSLLREASRAGEGLAEADLERIEAAVRQSSNLGRSLMAFAREEGESPSLLDLGQAVKEDLELLRLLLPLRIHLELAVAPGTYPVRAVRSQLQQVLVNLVGNARDAIAGSGRVAITLERAPGQPGWLHLDIADSGCGMDAGTLARLFQPLFTTKASGRGTGLGLVSVKAIAERMGGEVRVKSALGAGTTFTLRLPLAA